jgi:CheY-like chemotaxis protein
MKVLFVEDEPEFHELMQSELESRGIGLVVAENAEQAISLIDGGGFDLFLCDLRLPASLDAPEPHKEHGIRVYDHMRLMAPGVPIIVFSAYGELADLGDRLSEVPPQNLYGTGLDKLAISRKKSDVSEVLQLILDQHEALNKLDADIELSGAEARAAMGELDQRLVRIHARSHEAVTAKMELMAGGRSGALVLKVETKCLDGTLARRVVAKLNEFSDVQGEFNRYERFVCMLEAGTYTNHIETLEAGAQSRAGLFYALAGRYDGSLFGLVADSDSSAAKTVEELRESLRPWHEDPAAASLTVRDMRRLFVRDERLGELPDTVDWLDEALEASNVYVNKAPAHGDLHGGNVLVDRDGRPILIDFGRVGSATNAVDPITLELSVVLHPDAKIPLGGWPTLAQAEQWHDLPQYLQDCPIREFVSQCRKWAVETARGDREMDAVVLAYGLRQLLFGSDHAQVAAAYSRGAAKRLRP